MSLIDRVLDLLGWSATRPVRPWPASDPCLRCYVNPVAQIKDYSADRIRAGPLRIGMHGAAAAPADLTMSLHVCRDVDPLGRNLSYHSATRVRPAAEQIMFPRNRLDLEDVPGAWLRGPVDPVDRDAVVDLERVAVRRAWCDGLARDCLFGAGRMGFDGVMLDNCFHPSAGNPLANTPTWPWSVTIDVLRRVRGVLRRANQALVANIAGLPANYTLADADALLGAVDGVVFEQVLLPSRGSSADLLRTLLVMQTLLKAGLLVGLVPEPYSDVGDAAERDRLHRRHHQFLCALAALVAEPGQSLFVAGRFWEPLADYETVRAALGAPTEPVWISATGTLHRAFERGMVALDPRDTACVIDVR